MGAWLAAICISLIMSRRPNVGGGVGLADLYVDPALGFSLGWAAWVSRLMFTITKNADELYCSTTGV